MPAAIAVDREQVRMLVLSVGVRQAARQMGLSEDTVSAWSARYGWLQHITSPSVVKLPASMIPASRASKAPAQALEDTLAADGQATKIAAMRYARRASQRASELPDDEILEQAPNVKAVLGAAAIAGAWSGASGAAETVINIAMIGHEVRFGSQ